MRKPVGCHQPAHENHAVERKQGHAADKPPLLRKRRVHEVARDDGHVAHVAQLRAHAPPAAAHDRRQALERLPPRTRRVRERIAPHRQPRREMPRRPREHERHAARNRHERGASPEPRRRKQHSRTCYGELREQPEVARQRHGNRHDAVPGTQFQQTPHRHASVRERTGGEHHHAKLHEFRRIDAPRQVEPSPIAPPKHEQRRHKRRCRAERDPASAQQHPRPLAREREHRRDPAHGTKRVWNEESGSRHRLGDPNLQEEPQRRQCAHRGKQPSVASHHLKYPSRCASKRIPRATGAADLAPNPPPSTSTVTTRRGDAAGAKHVNQA